jgi:hypothetical protein
MKKTIAKLLCLSVATLMIVSLAIVPSFAKISLDKLYPLDEESPLQDLSIGFYGDSICSANCERDTDYADVRGWAGRIGAVSGCVYYNYGVSGASISNCRGSNTVINQLIQTKNAGRWHDMIVLHGGVNDAWDGIEVGEITDGYLPTDEYDPTTFAPALEQTLSYIEDNFPEAEVCYIINFKFLNTTMGQKLMDMDEYVDTTIEICEKWGIRYLDLYHDEEVVNMLHPKSGNSYSNVFLYDFVHPSTEGYDVLYPYINEFLIDLVDPWYNEDKEDKENKENDKENGKEDPETQKPDTNPPANDKDDTDEGEPAVKNGCGASLRASALVFLVAMIPGVVLIARKKEQ